MGELNPQYHPHSKHYQPTELTHWSELYYDIAKEIVKGACGPVLIHADKSKAKKTEAQTDHVRQHNGETLTDTFTSQ